MLRKFFSSILVLLMMFTLTSLDNHVSAENTQEIVVINETGMTISEFYAYYNESQSNNKIYDAPMKNGEAGRLMVDPDVRFGYFRIVFPDGKSCTWNRYDYSNVYLLRIRPSSNVAGQYMFRKN